MKTRIKNLRIKIQVLQAELATCTTKAMRASVRGSIDATEWELTSLREPTAALPPATLP